MKLTKEDHIRFFSQGHFDCAMPDGSKQDYDVAIPEYISKLLGHGEYNDSNGSEVLGWGFTTEERGKLLVRIAYNSHSFEKFEWPEEVIITLFGHLTEEEFPHLVVTDVAVPVTLIKQFAA